MCDLFLGHWNGISLFLPLYTEISPDIHLYTDADDLGPPLGQCRRICFYCDNQAVIAILSAKSSKIPCVMNLVWLITFQTLSFNFTFTAEHVPGVNNVIAEYLVSRYMSPFCLLASDALPPPCCPIPKFLTKV